MLPIFAKRFIINVWQGSEYAFVAKEVLFELNI